jgi:hypothetical protein
VGATPGSLAQMEEIQTLNTQMGAASSKAPSEIRRKMATL